MQRTNKIIYNQCFVRPGQTKGFYNKKITFTSSRNKTVRSIILMASETLYVIKSVLKHTVVFGERGAAGAHGRFMTL